MHDQIYGEWQSPDVSIWKSDANKGVLRAGENYKERTEKAKKGVEILILGIVHTGWVERRNMYN